MQGVPFARSTSAGHAVWPPTHTSVASHSPPSAVRQVTVGANTAVSAVHVPLAVPPNATLHA